ncbi:MAG: MFS transporter [Propionibacteriaceae bacterium]
MATTIENPSVGKDSVSLGLLTALYTTQFIGVGFLSIGLVAILRADGVSLDTLGLVQLLGLVWPLKFLWAPLIDKFSPGGKRGLGHYRSWLLVLQPLMVLALLSLVFISRPSQQLPLLFAIVGLFIVMSATQDIAADAISVRSLHGKKRDIGSAIQVSASYIGNVIGGAGAVVVADKWGLQAAAVLLAVTTAIALIPVVLYREPKSVNVSEEKPLRGIKEILGVFNNPACRSWCLIAMPLLYMGAAGVYSLVTPALTDSGRSLTEIGLITLTWASIPAIAAGMLAGWLSAHIGRRGSVIFGIVMLALGALVLTPVFNGGGGTLVAAVGVSLLLSGYTILNVIIYTQALTFARYEQAGSDFTLLTCIPLALSFVAAWLVLTLAQTVGYNAAAWVATALAVVGAVAAYRQLGADRV